MDPVTLRVVEALAKDVGRGIARLDPKDLEQIGAAAGDILSIAGERVTVAKAMPAFKDSRGKGVLQIDGIARRNAKLALDQRATVQLIEHVPARGLTLRPSQALLGSTSDSRYLSRLLEGLPVMAGDRIRASFFGARSQELEVLATNPSEGCVIVQADTRIVLESGAQRAARSTGIAYEDIGGLRKEIRQVREMIELPLRYPQIFERLGIDPPKGVLLHGAPGTGKTLLARAVAHETEAAFIAVSGPEIIHKFYGESEAKLREIFDLAARKAPAIIFLDEIDAIAPKRENVQGEVEKRVVAQLLALMDGLEGRGQVVVIGATNLPNLLDPALRRPGRFDREIEIGIPDASARRQVLEIHTRGMPLATDVDLAVLAGATHGFVGADLQALCREAAMTTLRAHMPEIDLTSSLASSQVSDELLMSLTVSMNDFLTALSDIEPSAIREVFVEIPDVSWSQVGGLAEVKRELREAIEWPLVHGDLLARLHLTAPKGILLYGPPGSGKTLLAKAVASQSGLNFISVKGPALLSRYLGESERGIREVFKKARQSAPCILFFDEIDALAPLRASSPDSGVSQRVLSQLLTELDGVEDLRGVLVLAATNRKDMLDPALLRPGRFDRLVQVGLPSLAERSEIFAVHLAGKPVAHDVESAELAARADGFSGAAIAAACQQAAVLVLRASLAKDDGPPDPATLVLTRAELLAAIDAIVQSASMAVSQYPE